MNRRSLRIVLSLLIPLFLTGPWTAQADDAVSKTSTAATGILFDYDASDFASYRIRDDGHLEITFARNTPDALYGEILGKLQNHPDIKGVLAGKDGPNCSRF